jgi:hypothetical protein
MVMTKGKLEKATHTLKPQGLMRLPITTLSQVLGSPASKAIDKSI